MNEILSKMADKKVVLSISIRELREKYGIDLDFIPNRYRLNEIFDPIVRQLQGKNGNHVANGKTKNGNNQKRKDKGKSQKYLTGTKAIQEKYKCSFEEAEKILIENKLNEESITTRKKNRKV